MTSICVTTPKDQMAVAAQEAANCIANGGGRYFRRLANYPRHLNIGDRVYYVEDGFIRGFAIVDLICYRDELVKCDTSGNPYRPGWYVYMLADSWQWIKPLRYKGARGWRYISLDKETEVVGGWLDAKPLVNA